MTGALKDISCGTPVSEFSALTSAELYCGLVAEYGWVPRAIYGVYVFLSWATAYTSGVWFLIQENKSPCECRILPSVRIKVALP